MTSADAAAAVLGGTELFAGLDDEAMAQVEARARLRRYRRGETIFLEGDAGDGLFAVVSGLVKVFVTSPRGEELVLATVRPGEMFGELALIDGGGRSACAEAVEASELVSLDRASFVELLRQRPELVDRLLRTLGSLVRRLTGQAGDLVFLDLHARIAKLLLSLADQHTGGAGPQEDIDVPFSQSDLARMVGASRQTVNQILRSFQATGFIALSGRHLRILRADALRKRAGS